MQHIHRVFDAHRSTYGSPRVMRALRAEGIVTSRRRVMPLGYRAPIDYEALSA